MILIAFPFNHAMGPWSPIFPLNCYSRPYGRDTKFVEVSLSMSFLVCHFIIALGCPSSLSIPTGGLLIIGIMPLIGQLNSIVAGLGVPFPAGSFVFATGLCVDYPCNQSISLVHALQILYMPLLVCYSDGGMIRRMLSLCLGLCRRS